MGDQWPIKPPVAAGPRESFCTKGRATGNHTPRFVMFAERRPGSEIHVTTRGIEVKHPDHAVFVRERASDARIPPCAGGNEDRAPRDCTACGAGISLERRSRALHWPSNAPRRKLSRHPQDEPCYTNSTRRPGRCHLIAITALPPGVGDGAELQKQATSSRAMSTRRLSEQASTRGHARRQHGGFGFHQCGPSIAWHSCRWLSPRR